MMYSSCILLTFTVMLVSTQCDDVSPERGENFTKVSKVDCTKEYYQSYESVIINASCKPHYRHVALKHMPGQRFNPSLVSVPRCDGPADAGLFCGPTPTGTRIRQVPVSVSKIGSNGQYVSRKQCTVVEVEEHVSCIPTGIEQATGCNAKQEYNAYTYKCVCKNGNALKAKCSDLHEWNDKECRCKCKQKNTDCTTGFTWDQDHCKCVKVTG